VETNEVLPAPPGPLIQVIRLGGAWSSRANSRSRGMSALAVGRASFAGRGCGAGAAGFFDCACGGIVLPRSVIARSSPGTGEMRKAL
jgi:hypothetical protein